MKQFLTTQECDTIKQANKEAQEQWLKQYEKLKTSLSPDEAICFIDGVHPTQSPHGAGFDEANVKNCPQIQDDNAYICLAPLTLCLKGFLSGKMRHLTVLRP